MAGHETSSSAEGITTQAVTEALERANTYALSEDGIDGINDWAKMVGDDDDYISLITGAERFMRDNPDVLKHRIASPDMLGLWMGLVVGAHVARQQIAPEA